MTMSDRTELIARLEKATGPDRELDRQIYCLRRPGHIPPMRMLVTDDDVPRFTSSLDAAMTLVPEDCEWEIGSAKLIGIYWAHLVSAAEEYKAKGKTPALALLIAIFKAQETQSNG